MYSTIQSRLRLHSQWNTRAFSYHPVILYAVATLLTILACFVLLIVVLLGGTLSPYLIFFIPIVVSAWIGGFKTGVYATVLSGILAFVFFVIPSSPVSIPGIYSSVWEVGIFAIEGLLISAISQNMHEALKKLEVKNTELKHSEQRYRLVVESVKDYAIYTLDKEGYITSWNKGSEHTKGFTQAEVLGKHYSIFFNAAEVGSGKPWSHLITAIENGKHEYEGWRIRKNGSLFWASVLMTPITDEAGTIYGFSVISRDMTERREMEKRKDEFISIASHELRTPVTSVKVFTQVLIKMLGTFPDKSPIKYLFKMEYQIDKLTALINDLLDVTRIQSGKIQYRTEPFDLKQLTQDVVENMQGIAQNHTIVCKGTIHSQITGDRDRVAQVLINLITNAIKYSPNADVVEIGLAQDSSQAILTVKDYGVGIPSANFSGYMTNKKKHILVLEWDYIFHQRL
ncbi:MAG TPA: PAS domain S-box protein [Candidatus Levybacteria bacterium]|nr:PAS domain S-box protein [Candidatus Levybacteria bacterium]